MKAAVPLAAAVRRLWRRFQGDRRGGLAVAFALWVPVGAVLVAGAIDLAAVNATRQRLQDTVDAAALDGARQMGMANQTGLDQRVMANVAAQLGPRPEFTYTVQTTTLQNPGRVTVRIAANRQSFFANLLPPGGWNLAAASTAEQMGTLPLCVLSSGSSSSTVIRASDSSRITAPGCLLHSNGDFQVTGSSAASAGMVQASGLASGAITPAPQSSAPAIADPFASMNMNPLLPLCLPVTTLVGNVTRTLLPGVHCGTLDVAQGGTLVLLPGEHYFLNGDLRLRQNAVLQGDNVVLFFDRRSKFQFTESSQIQLRGRRTGPFAGFVLATTRDNTRVFTISTTSARELLGTVYIPNATLQVSGSDRVADQSAWTVIVARAIQLNGSANLVINHNYAGSTVPVPTGVGPAISTGARLAQ